MCGISGCVGARDIAPVLVEGLRRLEYRGYGSAGVAVERQGDMSLARVPVIAGRGRIGVS
ncbi:MAG TPA: hypothetical protein PLP83_00130 [Candidatus Aminicenantes bacterium]|nr:hypothetical protein [Candidatus Aminicenantes bacterium]